MLNKEQARNILNKVLEYSRADETEVSLGGGTFALTRFAQNIVHQNTMERGYEVSVRTVLGKKTGRASTNRLTDKDLKRVVETALDITRHIPDDPELLPVLEPQEYRRLETPARNTALFSPDKQLKLVGKIINLARGHGLKASGSLSHTLGSLEEYGERGIFAVANSKGLFAYYGRQLSSLSVTIEGEDSSGWARQEGLGLAELNPETLAATAIDKAIKSQNPRLIDPGEYTVILEPAAVASLVWFLVDGFNALAYYEGRSFLKDKLGQKLAGENFTMLDDAYHPLYSERPFDDEGILKKKVILFDRGVAANLVYSRKEARKHKAEPTGHGLQVPNPWGARAGNIVVMGGEETLEEMIRTTEKGLLVTRFWYNRLVDPMRVIVTGMTRDGTFLVEKGKIKYGVKNLRFNQSVLEIAKNIRALSSPIKIEGMVAPAMKVDHFNFTSTTEF